MTNKIVNLSTKIDITDQRQKDIEHSLRSMRRKEKRSVKASMDSLTPKLDSSIEYANSLSNVSPDSSFLSDEVELKGSFYDKSDSKL